MELLVCDLDGTLVGPMDQGLETAKRAIDYCREKGIEVTIATGRAFGAAERYLEYFEIDQPAITNGGALVAAIGKPPIYEKQIKRDIALSIAEELRTLGYPFYFLVGKDMYTETKGPETEKYSHLLQFPIKILDSIEQVEKCPTQIAVRVPPQDADALLSHLDSKWAEVTLLKSLPHLLEIQPLGVSKVKGLEFLACYMGIPRENVFTIGDGLNDLDMLMWSGMKAAVANAHAAVKQTVPYVSTAPYSEGVMEIVEKFIR